MPHDGGIPFLREVVIFLAIAAIIVPLFQRVRISPVLGFLVAGVIVGPNGLGAFAAQAPWIGYITFTAVDSIAVLAEFGIVFLLFLIGASFALSSTAVVVEELVQRRELTTRVGRASF